MLASATSRPHALQRELLFMLNRAATLRVPCSERQRKKAAPDRQPYMETSPAGVPLTALRRALFPSASCWGDACACAVLERARLKPAYCRGVHVVGPRNIGLRFAPGEPLERFLTLMGCQLRGTPKLDST